MSRIINTSDNLVDLHINNLNNIQKIISRISNIGHLILTMTISISSILFPLIYAIETSIINKLLLGISSLIILICLFISHLVNLKNERLWRIVYESKAAIDIFSIKKNNKSKEIVYINFDELKNKNSIKLISLLKSWNSLIWVSFFVLNFVTIGVIFIA